MPSPHRTARPVSTVAPPELAQTLAKCRCTRERCVTVANFYYPTNVQKFLPALGLYGVAYLQQGIMMAPRPVTRKTLYVWLHEAGHFRLHALRRKARYLEEFEAEQWAHARMKEAGIPVPRCMTIQAKKYVQQMIRRALQNGAQSIFTEALAWTVTPLDRPTKRLLARRWASRALARRVVGV